MEKTTIGIPSGADEIITALRSSGYDAYVVGGCVRDSLLGKEPHDWDICTSATPDEMREVFSARRVYDTGVKHGTLTIRADDGVAYEVTTFRTDGEYSDNRHPDTVTYVRSLREDMARRDFTVNAMAYSKENGLVDYYGGKDDLNVGLIRCVGDYDARFQEDALRVLRALRFASVYGFAIEEQTAAAIHRNAHLLKNISSERIREELCKLLVGKGVLNVLLGYSDVMATIIPELAPCIGFEQNNSYHQYNVYDHIAHAVASYEGSDTAINVALLLHDIAKPQCYYENETGGHFGGHGVKSAEVAKDVTARLKFDNKTRDAIVELVLYHDSAIAATQKAVRRWLNKIGEERFRQLLEVQTADTMAHVEAVHASRLAQRDAVESVLSQVLAENQCFTMKDLAINGHDIMTELGLQEGRQVGDVLKYLLDKVIAGEVPNERDELLLECARGYNREILISSQ